MNSTDSSDLSDLHCRGVKAAFHDTSRVGVDVVECGLKTTETESIIVSNVTNEVES